MRVMEGQSFERPTDGKWIKLELTLDETDLLALLAEWGAEDPAALRGRIRASVAYDILSVQAQTLLSLRAYSGGGLTHEEVQIVLRQLTTRASKQKVAVGLAEEKS